MASQRKRRLEAVVEAGRKRRRTGGHETGQARGQPVVHSDAEPLGRAEEELASSAEEAYAGKAGPGADHQLVSSRKRGNVRSRSGSQPPTPPHRCPSASRATGPNAARHDRLDMNHARRS